MTPTTSKPVAQIDSYLHFDGNCAEAVRFYASTLGAKVETILIARDSPAREHVPEGKLDQVMHASLLLGERRLMASDWMDSTPYPGMHGFGVAVHHPSVAEARRIFDALAAGGRVNMPFDKTFWAEGFGMVVDRFGTPWMVGGGESPAG